MRATVVVLIAIAAALFVAVIEKQQTASGKSQPELILHSWRWWKSSPTYHRVAGEVTNNSANAMQGVKVVATFYDQSGQLVTTDSSFLEIDPLNPGASSPFMFTVRSLPGMDTATIQFSTYSGVSMRHISDSP